MKFFQWSKDGGPESKVEGFFFVEIKGLFSVALLRFGQGSRESFHSHAFDSISWLLTGKVSEQHLGGEWCFYKPSWHPVFTYRDTFHRVFGRADTSWVLTFRGPWSKTWREFDPATQEFVTLKNGRQVVQ